MNSSATDVSTDAETGGRKSTFEKPGDDIIAKSEKGATDAEKPPPPTGGEDSYPEGGTRAWLVAAGAASVLFCSLGYTNSFGVFQAYYSLHQLAGETPDRIAWIGSLQTFFIFATGIVAGPLFDRYGAWIIRPAALLYVFSVMMTSLCQEYWQFMLAQGVLTGVSNGLLMFPAMAATTQYFHRRRGAAMGIAIAGSSFGGVVFPTMLGKLLTSSDVGFGWAVRISAFVMVPLLAFACLAIRSRLPPRKSRFLLPEAWTLPLFDVLVAANFCLLLGMFTPLFFLPTFGISRGMGETLASYLVAIVNGASVPGRILPGVFGDRLGRLNVLVAAGASTALLIFVWPVVKTSAGVIVFAAFIGFCSGAIISGGTTSLTLVAADPRDIGTYMGMGMAVAAVAALIGPPVNGALLEKYMSFEPVSYFSGAFCVAGTLLALYAKVHTKEGLLGKV